LINLFFLLLPAALGMFASAAFFSSVHFYFSAFEFSVELIPFQRGETIIFLPPIGELRATTHLLPFTLKITLLNLNLDTLAASLEVISASRNISYLEEQLRSRMLYFLLRNAAIVFLCGGGSVYILSKRRLFKRALLGGALAVLLFFALFYSTVLRPYNIEAFETPQYTGIIEAAPWVVNLSEQAVATLGTMGEQLELMAANMHRLSEQMDQIKINETHSGLRILHVSDIHNNPAAFALIEKVVDSFAIDLIIDTGDLTDYGTALETEMIAGISSLPAPYLFVPGNHDSPQVVEALRQQGAVILGEEIYEISGLRITGLADPYSESSFMTIAPDEVLLQRAEAARARYSNSEGRPDLVAVHNPIMGIPFIGFSPLILSGHTHRAQVRIDQEGSTLINAGSTGAAGVRGLLSPLEQPYSMVVLYFNPDEAGRQSLVMADLLSIQQYQDSFTLKRYYNQEQPAINRENF
jgi:Icc-related predicted phosphoesterase